MDYRNETPPIIRDFLTYHQTIKNHSTLTVNEYFFDLRTFFRYLKQKRGNVPQNVEFDEISISDVGIELIASVTLADVYDFMAYLSRDREKHHNAPENGVGLNAASRSRKIATIRSFYKYLTQKANLMDENPVQNLDSPKLRRSLPRYLTVEQSIQLLNATSGKNRERDYCIITLFLNCGLRISELVGLNLNSVGADNLRVLGKGNKERSVFFPDSCRAALDDWLAVRSEIPNIDKLSHGALFVTSRKTRISTDAVHAMVKKTLLKAGLDASMYSSHKLRHTAATLMHQNGVDIRTLQEVLGHEHLNTTEIYTHIDNHDLRLAARASPLGKIKKSAGSSPTDNENTD